MSAQNGQSIQSDVLDAVVAALVAGGMNAFRTRFLQFAEKELPAVNVLPADDEFDYQDGSSPEELFAFDVRYLVSEVDGADAAADAQFVIGSKLLLALPPLGGLVRIVRVKKKKWEREIGEKEVMALVVTYETEFSSTRSDPSVASY